MISQADLDDCCAAEEAHGADELERYAQELRAAEVTKAALALDWSGKRALLAALHVDLGEVEVITLSAFDILDETRETMTEETGMNCEPLDAEAAPFLTREMALDACRSVSEDDWSSTYDEASWRVRLRLEKAAREARDDAQRLRVIGIA